MKFIFDDGGRKAAGYKGSTGDCVVRAVAIATEQPYQMVYDALAHGMQTQRSTRRSKRAGSGRNGVSVTRKWFKDYMTARGWRWTPTMLIGSGCTVHLADGELPMGRLVVSVSKHYTAVIDGVVHDTHDPQREGETLYGVVKTATGWLHNQVIGKSGGRCVYGYWSKS